jgi:hypothetical protein
MYSLRPASGCFSMAACCFRMVQHRVRLLRWLLLRRGYASRNGGRFGSRALLCAPASGCFISFLRSACNQSLSTLRRGGGQVITNKRLISREGRLCPARAGLKGIPFMTKGIPFTTSGSLRLFHKLHGTRLTADTARLGALCMTLLKPSETAGGMNAPEPRRFWGPGTGETETALQPTRRRDCFPSPPWIR